MCKKAMIFCLFATARESCGFTHIQYLSWKLCRVFLFTKNNCNDPFGIIKIGDLVQLKNVGTSMYWKCVVGKCSGIKDASTCDVKNWETFRIESADGDQTVRNLRYGDVINIINMRNL